MSPCHVPLSTMLLAPLLAVVLAVAGCSAVPGPAGRDAPNPSIGADSGAHAGAVSVTVAVPVEEAPLPPAAISQPPASTLPPPIRVSDRLPPPIKARAAVVIDGDSGAVLYEHDAHTPLPPASTTKILTALLAIERGRLDEEIEVALENRAYWGSVMGLQNGDRFTLRDLLYGLMLPSGNDAAYVIAVHIAGSEGAFAELMNQRMRQLGLVENSFINASGLGRDQTNLVSAYDLAQLTRHAMADPTFAAIVRTTTWTARGSRVIAMRNGNELLYRYPGADGVKIGWGGRTAGQTVVGSAVRNGHRLVVVLLNTPDRPGESAALLDWAFATFQWPAADSGR